MSKSLTLEEELRHTYAAIQHLQHDRSTVEIADELGISRFMVGRMIKRAREEGLIEVVARASQPVDIELSTALASRFGLKSAVVCAQITGGERQLRSTIARVASRLVSEMIVEDSIVGIGPGRSLVEMCRELDGIPACDLVQITGAISPTPRLDAELIVNLSQVAQGRIFPLHAPFLATDVTAATIISAQPGVKSALQRMDRLDMAVLTIGGWPDGSLLASLLDDLGELPALLERGVVAELGTSLFDADGHEIDALADRTIGISREQLARVPVKIALGGGASKRRAVHAVLKSGFLDILVTDTATARTVLRAD
jgi:DNA-binding transcriptional regulator LsrR (DeoR family)